jgi:hypothetical protein
LTVIFADVDGDVHFPDMDKFDLHNWIPTGQEMHMPDSKHQYQFGFLTLRRGKPHERTRWKDFWNISR